jgi:SAM-dependent methyltransferase
VPTKTAFALWTELETIAADGRCILFLRNNERINFSELERRVTLEIGKLARTSGSWPERAPLWQPDASRDTGTAAAMIGESQVQSEPARRRSIWRSLSHLAWGILHFPAVLRRAIAGVHTAEYARSAVEQLRQVTDALQTRAASTERTIGFLVGNGDPRDLFGEIDKLRRDFSTRFNEVEQWRRASVSTAANLLTRTEELAAQLSRVNEQAAMLRREVMFQQRQLTRLATPSTEQPSQPVASVLTQRHDSLYAAFEDVFRGSREDIIGRLAPYLERLTVAGAGQPDRPIVDIGCGRGEWLELLRREGLSAYGIDINMIMVERSVTLGLDARHADLMTHLHGLQDASRSAVTAFHVVEHLPFETLVDFLDESLRVLIPGGILILETPNPETVRVGATTFYNDPTHRNPLMPAVLQFVVEHRGFSDVEVLKLHPFVQGLLKGSSEDAQLLNRVLFGPQDFAIIARRV